MPHCKSRCPPRCHGGDTASCRPISDALARQVEAEWKATYPDSTLLPGFGLPSQNNGVAFLTHTFAPFMTELLYINQLPSVSVLSNNALYSFESVDGVCLNLYEAMIPDFPGPNGERSTVQIYLDALARLGLDGAGAHFHWTGQTMNIGEVLVAAIHHQSSALAPLEFTRRTIIALQETGAVVAQRMVMQPKPSGPTTGPQCAPVTDDLARQIEAEWKAAFPDTFLLPAIGLPSQGKGAGTLTHTLAPYFTVLQRINGLASMAPLANNALYSFENSRGKCINLYEVLLPDLPGVGGERSTVQIYINALEAEGIEVAGRHFHWTGATFGVGDVLIAAIHHQSTSLSPLEFTRGTIRALLRTLRVIARRATRTTERVCRRRC